MSSRDEWPIEEWTIQPKGQGIYIAQRSPTSKPRRWSKGIPWVVPTLVSIISILIATCLALRAIEIASDTLQAAVAPVLFEDSDDYCTQKNHQLSTSQATNQSTTIDILPHSEFSNLDNLYDCTAATDNDARNTVRTYILRSAGADPFRGWELLSRNLQATWSYDSFMARWQLVGYAEVGEITGPTLAAADLDSATVPGGDNSNDSSTKPPPSNERLPFNTFQVEIRLYQLKPEDDKYGNPIGEADLSNGWIATSFYEIHLRQQRTGWVIDSMVSTDRTVGGREYAEYGKVQLMKGKSTWLKRSHENPADIAWTNNDSRYGKLPVYCTTIDSEGKWYRTSLGWALESDVQKISSEVSTDPKSFSKKSHKFDGQCLGKEQTKIIELEPVTPGEIGR